MLSLQVAASHGGFGAGGLAFQLRCGDEEDSDGDCDVDHDLISVRDVRLFFKDVYTECELVWAGRCFLPGFSARGLCFFLFSFIFYKLCFVCSSFLPGGYAYTSRLVRANNERLLCFLPFFSLRHPRYFKSLNHNPEGARRGEGTL